jgi:hypothetical protein
MKRIGSLMMWTAVLSCAGALAQTTTNEGARLVKRAFRDYTIMLLAKPDEPWQASWNDKGQMGILTNPSNNVVITCQFLKFPADPALQQAKGDRDQFMDIALRKYCIVQFSRSDDREIMGQPVTIESRTLADHYFRYCPIVGRDGTGNRRGFFYIMLRGPANRPQYTGDTLILTIGYPELIAPAEERQALKTFDIMLQNISFY